MASTRFAPSSASLWRPMSDALDTRQREIADEFAFLDDWMLKYQHLIEHAKTMAPLAPEAPGTPGLDPADR